MQIAYGLTLTVLRLYVGFFIYFWRLVGLILFLYCLAYTLWLYLFLNYFLGMIIMLLSAVSYTVFTNIVVLIFLRVYLFSFVKCKESVYCYAQIFVAIEKMIQMIYRINYSSYPHYKCNKSQKFAIGWPTVLYHLFIVASVDEKK